MADTLYKSYSLTKSSSNGEVVTSGSLTTWENTPVSPLDVGDTFRPIPNGPLLTVKKVNISDKVIGTNAGKSVRQWQISVEGDNQDETSIDTQTYILYNFAINADEHSGTMEVTNTGKTPSVTLNIGDSFRVPGVGEIPCVNIKGSDSYDDNGNHVWTIVYEGSDAEDAEPQQDTDVIPEDKYSLTIEKDSDGVIQKSGSKVVVSEGNAPDLNIHVGSTFNIPGIGNVTCSKVSGSDDYTDSGAHRWTMTYEGYINSGDSGDDPQSTETSNDKYSFSIEKDNSGSLVHFGSIEVTSIADTPPSAYQVGSTINIPGIGNVTCIKVSGSDSYTDSGQRKWVMVYEASDSTDDSSGSGQQEASAKYSFDIEHNSDGITVYSGTKEISYTGDTPAPGINVGDVFSIPVAGYLTCTKVRGSDDGTGLWTFVIEGSRSGADSSGGEQQDDSSIPDDEISISYELNGSTARTVGGEFIALRRSNTAVKKTSITKYSDSQNALASIGEQYESYGIALSENIIKETIKKDNVIIRTYYKHTIEVEA